MANKRYVIVGNGAAGISAAESIRSLDRQAGITIISDEPHAAYSKVLLHYFIDARIDKKGLFIRSDQFYRDLNIDTLFGIRVERVLPEEQVVCLAGQKKIQFDRLLIATGSLPVKPPIKGIDQKGVFTMWTLADAVNIRRSLQDSWDGIVIGGSFVGMQALDTLIKRGKKVAVVDIAKRIMPHILDEQGAAALRDYLEKRGVEFYLSARPTAIKDGEGNRKTIFLKDGRQISADLCVVAAGARPNIDFVEGCSLKRNVGLIVDEHMRTNCPQVFAGGDVAEVVDCLSGERRVFGLWSAAAEQGRLAGLNMAGKKVAYSGGLDMNTINVLGLPILTVGQTHIDEKGDHVAAKSYLGPGPEDYRKFIIKDGVLIGAILMGRVEDGGLIGSLIRSRFKFDPEKIKYSMGSFRYRKNYLTD